MPTSTCLTPKSDRSADARHGLPQHDHGAGRILDHRHPSRVHHVEGWGEDLATEAGDLGCGAVHARDHVANHVRLHDLSFSKVEPLLRSFQRLTHGPEPDLVHLDRIDGSSDHTHGRKWDKLRRTRSYQPVLRDIRTIAPTGWYGAPEHATVEKGMRMLNDIADAIANESTEIFALLDQGARHLPVGRESRSSVSHRADETMALHPRKMTGRGSL